ncbi:unnamed protein product [Cyprideis torosa]|uniref:18S rRNA (pseudouridine-N1)-methyltransferase n=1 Tax=Cyprideis torosa TaxID=163714 RepID=A0A7R8ZJB7_9CRUS|nr:unnamed protein product [Cyprideis torosa]CAG0881923.1 unnamed protein product [Cyprideis torosa]
MGRKRKQTEDDGQRDLMPVHLSMPHKLRHEKRLIIVLENAQLETVKVGQDFALLNPDDHIHILHRMGRDASTCRPDITHQCLMMLLDSPLNRAGLLQVYVHTSKNVLIEVHPQTRIPRTFKRFAGLMVQLLHKLSVKAQDRGIKLMKIIKNPVSDHLPAGCPKYSTSCGATDVRKASQCVPEGEDPVVFVIGAMAHGKLEMDYTEGEIAIGNYPLSAALTCTKLCSAFEDAWEVL